MTDLKPKIQEHLSLKKESMRQLANRAGVSVSAISRFLSNDQRDMLSTNAAKIERALELHKKAAA